MVYLHRIRFLIALASIALAQPTYKPAAPRTLLRTGHGGVENAKTLEAGFMSARYVDANGFTDVALRDEMSRRSEWTVSR